MPEFVIDTPAINPNPAVPSVIGNIHALLEAVAGCQIFRGDMNTQRARKPYMVYNTVFEMKYKRHQILKHITNSPYNLPIIEYKQPHKFRFQYTIVEDSQKLNSIATLVKNLSRYLVEDKFKLAMDRLNVGFYVASDITEYNVPIEGFSDRQFIFQMDYFWADIWTDQSDNAGAGFIDTINEAQVAPPVGA